MIFLKNEIPELTNLEVHHQASRLSGELYFSKPIRKYLKSSHGKFHSEIPIGSKVTKLFSKKIDLGPLRDMAMLGTNTLALGTMGDITRELHIYLY